MTRPPFERISAFCCLQTSKVARAPGPPGSPRYVQILTTWGPSGDVLQLQGLRKRSDLWIRIPRSLLPGLQGSWLERLGKATTSVPFIRSSVSIVSIKPHPAPSSLFWRGSRLSSAKKEPRAFWGVGVLCSSASRRQPLLPAFHLARSGPDIYYCHPICESDAVQNSLLRGKIRYNKLALCLR